MHRIRRSYGMGDEESARAWRDLFDPEAPTKE
jgi:hypothetical protein